MTTIIRLREWAPFTWGFFRTDPTRKSMLFAESIAMDGRLHFKSSGEAIEKAEVAGYTVDPKTHITTRRQP